MTVHFYRYDPAQPERSAPPLPPRLRVRSWQPGGGGRLRPPLSNLFWWALARAGSFKRTGFTEICIDEGRKRLHRLIVTPRWYRFPFMGAGDLQIGEVWTAPGGRRRQLARIAMAEARRFAGEGTALWYVTDADNVASAALARSCGYRLVATGRRTRRLGIALLGQYVIDEFV